MFGLYLKESKEHSWETVVSDWQDIKIDRREKRSAENSHCAHVLLPLKKGQKLHLA